MVKKLSRSKFESLQKKGARVVGGKPSTPDAPKASTNSQQIKAIDERVTRIETVVDKIPDLISLQNEHFKALIDRLPQHDDLPPIVGLKFIHDEDGVSTGIKFIREERLLN